MRPMPETMDFRSECPLASALDIIGDKWSLLVVRGLFVGLSRYGDFLKMPEQISTNILADRLRQLECAGIITRLSAEPGTSHHRYGLTRKGADLLPILQALATWGFAHIGDRWTPPAWFLKAKPSHFYPK
jgi:DNA-binding HxlR family transcriptional regulator